MVAIWVERAVGIPSAIDQSDRYGWTALGCSGEPVELAGKFGKLTGNVREEPLALRGVVADMAWPWLSSGLEELHSLISCRRLQMAQLDYMLGAWMNLCSVDRAASFVVAARRVDSLELSAPC